MQKLLESGASMDQKDKVAQMADVTFTPELQDYFLTFILYYNPEMFFFLS